MTYDQLKEHLMEFFSDTSRSPSETKDGLEDIAAEAEMLAESIPDGDGDED